MTEGRGMREKEEVRVCASLYRSARASLEQADRSLTAAVSAAHEAGVGVTALAELSGLSRPTVYQRLAAHSTRGH